jgi:rod shape-determining protein MreC
MAVARRTSRRRYVLLIIVLTAITLITLDTRNGRSGPIGTLGDVAHTVVGPVQRAVDGVTEPVSDWWHGVTNGGDIKRENRELKEQLAEARGRETDAQIAIDQNKELKALLDLRGKYDVELVTASIVGRDPGNFSSTLQIDKGSAKGIAEDMPVVAPDGSLVGRVLEVGDRFATIRVVTDPRFAVGVQIVPTDGSNKVAGTAEGRVGERDLIVRDSDPTGKIAVGDIVTTSPQSTTDPPDVPVGLVSRIENLPGGQNRNVFIKPFVDIGALQHVSVMLWVQGEGPVVITTTTTTTTPTSTTTTVP